VTLESPRAQYQHLAERIRGEIERGEHAPGSALPSEDKLAQRYGVDRTTVNRAEAILRREGMIRVERGRGAIVRELPVIRRNAATRVKIREEGGARGAFQAELERLGLTARSEVEVSETTASDDIAAAMGLDTGAPVIARRREMFANDVPVQLATSYLPADIAAGTQLAQPDTGTGGAYSRLADLGFEPVAFTESVRVRLADDAETHFLRLDTEQRILFIRRTARTAAGRIVEVTDTAMPAHQWELVYDWTNV
jgi:GntR family transcriptional regulator